MKRLFLLAASISLAIPTACNALEVISHDPVSFTSEDVRDAFLGEKLLVGHLKLVPVDNTSLQDEFLAKALQTDHQKYYARWSRKIYREGLTLPVAKGTDAEVLAFVKATPGAIGYVSKAPPGVNVVHGY